MSTPDALSGDTAVLVTVEDPPMFEALVNDWAAGVVDLTGLQTAEEMARPDDTERTPEQLLGFARCIRDAVHQADLERAAQPPIIQVNASHSGAIEVTRRARHMLQTGAVSTVPQPAVAEVPAGEEAGHAHDAAGSAAHRLGADTGPVS